MSGRGLKNGAGTYRPDRPLESGTSRLRDRLLYRLRLRMRICRVEPVSLANFCQSRYGFRMGTMNISLPDQLKSFVDEQVAGRGYGTSSEYIRELIRRDQDRLALRGLLFEGASSARTDPADADYFTSLRDRVRGLPSR
jgi:antitoxin ParD1/3/4